MRTFARWEKATIGIARFGGVWARKADSVPRGRWLLRLHCSEVEMLVNPDFKDLLKSFNAHRVEYLMVGAHERGSLLH